VSTLKKREKTQRALKQRRPMKQSTRCEANRHRVLFGAPITLRGKVFFNTRRHATLLGL